MRRTLLLLLFVTQPALANEVESVLAFRIESRLGWCRNGKGPPQGQLALAIREQRTLGHFLARLGLLRFRTRLAVGGCAESGTKTELVDIRQLESQ